VKFHRHKARLDNSSASVYQNRYDLHRKSAEYPSTLRAILHLAAAPKIVYDGVDLDRQAQYLHLHMAPEE
jgi:hypothetical protein